MGKPVNTVKVGMCEFAQWQGEYKGKPTTSFSLKKQKYNEETKKYEDTPFLTITDIKDIMIACQKILFEYYSAKNTTNYASVSQTSADVNDEAPF